MTDNNNDLVRTIFKALGIIAVLVLIVLLVKGEFTESENIEVEPEEIATGIEEQHLTDESSPKTYVYNFVTVKKPVITSTDLKTISPYGMEGSETFCKMDFKDSYFVGEEIKEIENYSSRDKYNLIDEVRENPNIRELLNRYNREFANDLIQCPREDRKSFQKGDWKASIEDIKILTFDTYEEAWEDREQRR